MLYLTNPKFFLSTIFFLFLSCSNVIAQPSLNDTDTIIRVAFYNLENLFDTYNDSTKNDDDFTPTGIKGWSKKKFTTKIHNTYKAILSVGETSPVEIMGICEVENAYCIKKLLYETPLKVVGYRYIHYESPDKRGIDVALIYRPEIFKPLFHKPIRVVLQSKPPTNTRDILYVKGLINSNDTLHLFVCHLPSRLGGAASSSYKRIFVASIIRHNVDSILNKNPNSNVIVMGDMNDEPENESMSILDDNNSNLINLMSETYSQEKTGTLKYGAFWNIFDQIIVTKNLLTDSLPTIRYKKSFICNNTFMHEKDSKYGGSKLHRTYNGAKYQSGYSDHLPVYIDIITKKY